ncbi:hypothetical protein A4D02_26730 [Niastella koreensis]|uniref:DUF1574 domain-containing protein n=2 Tax=Niastella koreensis TaxID=354356 RepID=G8TEL5_NIAKG|nr:DUF1574 family protein [Niastella koreensis]AEV99437.1 hypothetical protein Niako_3107 [Niastella koreensis GR20-10]OQP50036.1 hypothetical protein A4D02_26730 [Niastella koreensis]
MRKFTKQTIACCLPVLILLVCFELLLRHIPNDYSYKKEYLDRNASNIEVLVLGSSHSYYGINPAYIKGNVFNASHVSQTIDLDWEIIKKYKWSNLKYILLPVDYFTLYYRLDQGVESWRLKNYQIYYGITSTSLTNYFELTNGRFKDNINRVIRYYVHRLNDVNCDTLGYGINFNLAAQDLETSGKEAAAKHTIKSTAFLQKNIGVLSQFAAFAKENKIKLILFSAPAYKSYRNNLNRNQLQTTVNAIEKTVQSNPNVVYYNFLTDTIFKASDYSDADHLNPAGAKKLSSKLNDRISY